MKRSEFIRWLQQHDCVLHRNGGRHDIYVNLKNGKKQPVPRHNEIDDLLVKHIKKQLGLDA
ncbi:type II toxin-antitoxin system HicA family toxin [Methylovulum miyakonense]|uniref:type II toxin-antitoxin system HicA family toxin n=1 Tax=Methylovulum miyakonense TaxID=645578 RepID=UPI00037B0EE0|nr:type II toxin-antitoxin system HicA family toxin [Methylovulum miyakonense]